jgi:ABC-2 type transport system ATP-binding protein
MIEVDRAVKRYAAVTAVDEVSFTAQPGRVTALLGPNGAGKTSVLRMIVGLTRPDRGRVTARVGGRLAARHEIGYLPEERGLYKDTPVLRSLSYFGRLAGLEAREADRAAAAWLDRLGLADKARHKVDSLSRGNQQKVQLAAAVLHRPTIVILDEPFSGLDPLNQDLFILLVRELCERGATVLLSAHEMSLVERAADRLVLLRTGQVVLDDEIGELQRRFGAGDVHEIDFAAPVTAALLAGHPAVTSVEAVAPASLRVIASRPLGEILSALDVAGIAAVRSGRVSLHDIYVSTMATGAPPSAGGPP